MTRGWVLVCLLLGGCTTANTQCVTGMSVACVCTNGEIGAQVCRPDHTFDPCECRGDSPVGSDMAVAAFNDMTVSSGDMAIAMNADMPLVSNDLVVISVDLANATGPAFLAFGTNVDELTEGETVIFSAVLTDSSGLDDLAGGVLRSPDGSVFYGTFGVGAQKGAYSLSLRWFDISQAQSIDILTSYETMRTFTAQFFDAHGRSVLRDTQLRLYCFNSLACNGDCGVNLNTDRGNCGSCGNICDNQSYGCSAGKCGGLQSCVLSTGSETCDARCGLTSQVCQASSSRVWDTFTACVVAGIGTTLACDVAAAAGKYYRCYCNNP